MLGKLFLNMLAKPSHTEAYQKIIELLNKALEENGICFFDMWSMFLNSPTVPTGFKAAGVVMGFDRLISFPMTITYNEKIMVVDMKEKRKQFILDNEEPGQMAAVAAYIDEQFTCTL